MILKINTKELVKFTNKLEKLHRSALPVAVRETLTRAAKDVKTKSMPKHSKVFVKRQPNFFKANSKYAKAEGFDIKKMKATVGFFDNRLAKQATNYAVKDLLQQERGGTIRGKAFIAMRAARKGRGIVRENFRMDQIRQDKIITAKVRHRRRDFDRDSKTGYKSVRDRKQGFIRAAFMAVKKGGYVLGNKNARGSRTLSKIDEIWGSTKRSGLRSSRKLQIKRTPIYSVKKNRAVTVKRTDFMKRASMESALQLNAYYIENAQKQIAKYINR